MPDPFEDLDPSMWKRLDALFESGLAIAPAEREAWLEGLSEEPEICNAVAALLHEADEPAEILEPEAFARGPLIAEILATRPGPGTGEQIGVWSVLEKLGEGGMGSVYRVERSDGAFEQQAALKLIRADAWSPETQRRFEAERQLLARLDHPGIARLLDGGETEDGRPYLVMECVDGEPLDVYCDRWCLSIHQRLVLFLRMCRAVEAAHRALVVHRDLKPNNVVVTAEGDVKLLDFGIARALAPDGERVQPTRTLVRIMTPDYASPEQVLGHPITTATDVYQLGLLLYLLLTGKRAQRTDSLSPAAFEQVICETPPPLPSLVARSVEDALARARTTSPGTLAGRLRGDLDAIVSQALRKEPEHRYASVARLAEDIERHLQGRPVAARPNSLGYRLGRWVVRRRRALVWAALVLAVLVAAGAVVLDARLSAARDARRADQIVTVIESLFQYPRVSETGEPPRMRDFAEDALLLVRRELRDQPAHRARLLARLGRTFSSIGAYDRAAAVFDEALGGIDANDERARADLLYQKARNQHYAGELVAAEQSFLWVEQTFAVMYGSDHERTLAAVVERGDLLHSLGRLQEAQATLEPAISTLHSGRTQRSRELHAHALGCLGNILRDRGLHERAESAYQDALDRIEWLAPRATRAASHSIHYARLLTLLGRFDEAERRLHRELAVLREVHFDKHPLIATSYRELAFQAMSRGNLERASEYLARAVESSEAWLEPDHPTIPRIHSIEAELERRRGHPAEAITRAHRALDLFSHLGLAGHPSALDACITLGTAANELAEPLAASQLGYLEGCLKAAESELVERDARISRLRVLVSQTAEMPVHPRAE